MIDGRLTLDAPEGQLTVARAGGVTSLRFPSLLCALRMRLRYGAPAPGLLGQWLPERSRLEVALTAGTRVFGQLRVAGGRARVSVTPWRYLFGPALTT